MEFISDIISDEEFESWQRGQRVFITAATGSGKSTFILEKLLIERVIKNGEKMLYLVNRRILKGQLKKEIESKIRNEAYKKYENMCNVTEYIEVMTYQSIEERIQYDFEGIKNKLNGFHIVVYDECHYFYMDSNFNTHTELSYDCLRRLFNDKIQVFMSATMEKVRECIDRYEKKYSLLEPVPFRLKSSKPAVPVFPMYGYGEKRLDDKIIPMDKDYSYVNIKIFDTYEDLAGIISGNMKEKWIVFVDSIEKGKDVEKQIYEKIQGENNGGSKGEGTNDIILIEAKYRDQKDSNNAVEEIIEYKEIVSYKVIIATSVMDNGISLVDKNLKNIAILYDTEEEFIQMLGRKRINDEDKNENINLYICKRDSNHFRLRKQGVERKIQFYNKYGKAIDYMYKRKICFPEDCPYNCSTLFQCPDDCKNIFDVTPFADLYWTTDYSTISTLYTRYYYNYKKMYQINYQYMLYMQQTFLPDILDKNFNNQILYSLNGFIAVNYFSINRLIDLERFYSEMEEDMENDEYAFLIEQMGWIGIKEDKAREIICNICDERDKEYSDILRKNIEPILGKPLNSNDNRELKSKIKDALVYFMVKDKEDEEKENIRNRCRKDDRTVSVKDFNMCMEKAQLHYQMEKPNQKEYQITVSEEIKKE